MLHEKYGAVIPAFNEELHIGDVLSELKEYFPANNIIVVDDGSSDDTAGACAGAGICLIRHEQNRGKGAALRTGFSEFLKKDWIKGVFTLDADGQHAPSEIAAFVDKFEETGADIIIGNRMDDTVDMPFIRKMTNILTSRVISWRAGCRIDDSQSGYRLISRRIMEKIELVTEHFETESEILIKAGRAGALIDSVKVSTIYASEISKINPYRDTIRFFKLVFKSYFW